MLLAFSPLPPAVSPPTPRPPAFLVVPALDLADDLALFGGRLRRRRRVVLLAPRGSLLVAVLLALEQVREALGELGRLREGPVPDLAALEEVVPVLVRGEAVAHA